MSYMIRFKYSTFLAWAAVEVKIGELERGCFTGAGKLDQCMLTFRSGSLRP